MVYKNQDNDYDCLQTTFANLLSIDKKEVPEFHKLMKPTVDLPPDLYLYYVELWLDKLGMSLVCGDVENTDNIIKYMPHSNKKFMFIGFHKKKPIDGFEYSHATLLKYDNRKITIEHDPQIKRSVYLDSLYKYAFVIHKSIVSPLQ